MKIKMTEEQFELAQGLYGEALSKQEEWMNRITWGDDDRIPCIINPFILFNSFLQYVVNLNNIKTEKQLYFTLDGYIVEGA